MPLYSYLCKDCGAQFDLLVGVTADKTVLQCKKCKSAHIEKTFATFSMGKSGGISDSSSSYCPTGTCPM